ncbi:MAG TPA: hypothetical protein VFZ58_03410 [Candidatus Saccharimonadales bacterium]
MGHVALEAFNDDMFAPDVVVLQTAPEEVWNDREKAPILNISDVVCKDLTEDSSFERVAAQDFLDDLWKTLATLPKVEAEIILLYYGLLDEAPLTFSAIGERYGVHYRKIWVMHQRAMDKLAVVLKDKWQADHQAILHVLESRNDIYQPHDSTRQLQVPAINPQEVTNALNNEADTSTIATREKVCKHLELTGYELLQYIDLMGSASVDVKITVEVLKRRFPELALRRKPPGYIDLNQVKIHMNFDGSLDELEKQLRSLRVPILKFRDTRNVAISCIANKYVS